MRYLPLTETDRRAMLGAIGVPSVDSLFRDVPAAARLDAPKARAGQHGLQSAPHGLHLGKFGHGA